MEFITMQNIEEITELLKNYFDADEKELVMPMMLKAMEELGELSQAVLGREGYLREGKKTGEIEEEMADAIGTLLILSHVLGIDIEKVLKHKMLTIIDRLKK